MAPKLRPWSAPSTPPSTSSFVPPTLAAPPLDRTVLGTTPRPSLDIVFNDFPGHPAFAELSTALGCAGHRVMHVYCSTMEGPQGSMADQPNVNVVALRVGHPFPRHKPLRRIVAEVRYGLASVRAMSARSVDVLVANQMPVLSLNVVRALKPRLPIVVWLQDIQSDLTLLASPGKQSMKSRLMFRAERRALRRAQLVMPISNDMGASRLFDGIATTKIQIRPNWGNPDVIRNGAKLNAFSREHDLHQRPTVLYSGTLGLKHHWEFLADLGRKLQDVNSEARLVVVSVGPHWQRLHQIAVDERIDTLVCLPLQPYENLSDVLASADVLLATLRDDAAVCSVPSKVLSYLCAGRPIAALVPPTSPIWNLVNVESRSGLATSDPHDLERFILECLDDPGRAAELGANGRSFAEVSFDLDVVARELITALESVIHPRSGSATQSSATQSSATC